MTDTLGYYDLNAKTFGENTRNVEFQEMQDKFLSYLKPGARILDFGCGSGRDTKYFLSKGYQAEAVDGSAELVKMASEYTKIEVRQMLFQELDSQEIYDGIWACASILHLRMGELEDVFVKMGKALVSGGILYTSFKHGTGEKERNGRLFTDMDEDGMRRLLEKVDLFLTEDMWVTSDVRPGREDERWLNIILRKKN